jgi:hypothetical protein
MRITLDDAERIARPAVLARLAELPPIPEELRSRLVLGKGPADGVWVFELYVAYERPEDAVVLAEARVDRVTGEVAVRVFPDRWRRTGQ